MSSAKRCVCTFFGFSTLVLVALCTIYAKLHFSTKYLDGEKTSLPVKAKITTCRPVCTTKDCVLTAAQLHTSTDHIQTDPCNDFYSYSCGNLPIQISDETEFDESMTQRLYYMKVANAIKDASDSAPKPVLQAKRYYDHCLDFKSYEESDIAGLLDVLSDVGLAGWPHLSQNWTYQTSNGNPVSVDYVLYKLHMLEFTKFVEISYNLNTSVASLENRVGIDVKIKISSRMPLKKEHLHPEENAKALEEHRKVIEDMLLYMDVGIEKASMYAKEIMQFQAKLHSWLNETSNQEYKSQSLSESEWKPLVQMILENSGIPLSSVDVVILSKTQGFRKLLEERSQSVIGNYLAYRFAFENIADMGFFFRNLFRSQIGQYTFVLDNLGKPKWETCALRIFTNFIPALSYYSLQELLTKETLEELDDVFFRIRNTTMNIFDNITWMHEANQNKMKVYIMSIPPLTHLYATYLNRTYVEKLYENLELQKKSYFGNFMEYTSFKTHFNIKDKLIKGWKHFLRGTALLGDGASAMKEEGIIRVGFPFLQMPIFSAARTKLFNLAIMGSIIGHEMTHLINHFYDENIVRLEDKPKYYEDYEQCIAQFYSKYKYDHFNMSLKVEKIFSENFADLLGTEIAYQTFNQAVIENEAKGGKFAALGMNLTNDQLFFVLFAQYYCPPSTKDTEMLMIDQPYGHSPNKYRILGTTSNLHSFEQAFKCPMNSPMNPEHKCIYIQ